MQIELQPETEAMLASEAERRHVSISHLCEQILAQQTLAWAPQSSARDSLTEAEQQKVLDRHIAWMKNSPGFESRDPYAVDWQAIKTEGRKY